MAVDAEEVGISLYNLETWSEYALYYWVRDCFRVDSGTCSVTWNKCKAAKILTCLDACVCACCQFSFDLVSNLVNESGDAYRWCSRSGPYTLLIVDMVSIPFDSYSSGANNIPTTGVFTLSQCRGLFWVRYVIVRLCTFYGGSVRHALQRIHRKMQHLLTWMSNRPLTIMILLGEAWGAGIGEMEQLRLKQLLKKDRWSVQVLCMLFVVRFLQLGAWLRQFDELLA